MGMVEAKVAQVRRAENYKTSVYSKVLHRGMSTFDEVVKAYESITPIRNKQLTGLRMTDRRPLNARWKWWNVYISLMIILMAYVMDTSGGGMAKRK